ncbi:acyl-CoA synthetase [Haladaptatus salinisoli]|uniref:acyl-CoA synthetase n=1 Tax=Haladaptatus salinisoli TaxID=2884876 RepID=UPI001D0AF0AC|nr:benzoate-CoA ligase family protein [Haladaptatus salinisoli]
MQANVPQGYLPSADKRPDFVHTLPEVHYPQKINVAAELMDSHIDEGRGSNVAIRFRDDEFTYTDLQKQVNRLGNALLNKDVEPGDRVIVRFSNRPEAIISCLAIQKIGAVALPSMKLLRAKELTYIINNSEAKVAIVFDRLLDELEMALDDLDTLEEVIVVNRSNTEHDHADYDELLNSASTDLDPHQTERDDLALMLYTSGTTGRPKGTIHTHRQLLATADGYAQYCLEPTEDDVFGGNSPLPFAFGYGALVTFPLRFGATTSLVEDAKPGQLLQTIENHGITVLCSIPTAFNQIIAKYPDGAEQYDVSSLRVGMSAGEPLTPTTFDNFEEQYGITLLDGIGTTEMLHVFVSHRHTENIDPNATGFPVPGYECKIVDPDTYEDVPRGTPGLLAVRGPTGMTYWNRPDKQEEVIADGWSLPGDIFVQREDGRFEYKSRRDDLIISSGYNIPGTEVESVLESHDAVADVAVVGSPDSERGQIVKAFIVPSPDAETGKALVSELQNLVKTTLAPYKYPRAVTFVENLPRTETGKIQRKKLRDQERKLQTTQ